MTGKARLRLELVGRVAFLVLVVAMFPDLFAQQRGIVWLQAVGICVMLTAGVVGLYAGIQLKNSREPTTPLIDKVRRASALAFLVIWVGEFGVFAVLSNTRRGWEIWAITSLPLVAFYFWNTRYPKV